VHPQRDHFLPPDLEAYRRAEHPRGRVIVIAPTRAACETIELALQTRHETLLERQHGATLIAWARAGKRFGIVAGTGTGKTLATRFIAEAILEAPLRVGVVNREREATAETALCNTLVITTGIARRWLTDDLVTARDTVVVDEIHQTSAELELCLALGKRAGCRFIWLSATVDPTFYAQYLGAEEVLVTRAFDPALKAKVEIVQAKPEEFFDDRTIKRFIREQRGVAVFLPTRAEVEKLGAELGASWEALSTAFYHGGEPIRVIRPFLEGEVNRPFLLAMTAAGQSALNVPGLDTVVIYDARYGNVVDRGRNVLHRMYLGANEILQMAGRVHGRVPNGEVWILSDRDLDFGSLRPGPPEFQLAGDAERVALTCAALGVDATDLELPVELDRRAYRRALRTLTARGLIEDGRLTRYGREVDALPVERPWGELLVQADTDLVPVAAVCASIDSLHRMTREERDLHGVLASGSDHLTAYNLYAEAVSHHGSIGEVYGLPRHLFAEEVEAWAERRGVLLKAIEDAALGVASVYRALELPLPPTLPYASKEMKRRWAELVARVMPFDLVLDEQTADGQEARVGKTSVAGSWGAVAGSLRYFADRFGRPRASIEGTTIGYDLVRRFAAWGPPEVEVDGRGKRQGLVISRRLTYFGFELESDVQPLDGEVSPPLRDAARRALARAVVAGSTRHGDQGAVTRAVERLREYWRRSGGTLAAASDAALVDRVAAQLDGVVSWADFLRAPLHLEVDVLVPGSTRAELDRLPGSVRVHGDVVPVEYEVERGEGIARIWLREGQARRLDPRDLPPFDRPVRYGVARGRGEEVRAASLEDLRDLLRRQPARERARRAGRSRPPGHGRGRRR